MTESRLNFFSEEFTNMDPVDSPAIDPEVSENLFASYSYVAPSILFTENNVISEDMFRPDPDKKPSEVRECRRFPFLYRCGRRQWAELWEGLVIAQSNKVQAGIPWRPPRMWGLVLTSVRQL